MPATPDDLPRPTSRNAPCPCGSGRRYKECHGRLDDTPVAQTGLPLRGSDASAIPRDVALLNDRGTVLQAQHRYDEALECFDAALERIPDHPGMLRNRGNALLDLRRHEDAVRCFARLVDVASDHPWALGSLYQAQMLCCDWTSIDALADRIGRAVRQRRAAITPFVHLTVSDSPADQLEAARIEASLYRASAGQPGARTRRYGHRRIRLAYLSGDFREHAVAQLAAHLFESHDRSRFELTAISFGPDTGDPMRRRLERAFDHFIDVRGQSDADVAASMREREIDIAVDLMGYTRNGRPALLARRAVPVQVGYLGYAGTTGAPWMDYIVADPHVIAPGEDIHYAERVVRLPDTYFPHDPGQPIGVPPTREEAGLADSAFVFCCFNNNYKITPSTFDVWMRLLARVDDAVLWLLAPNEVAQRNLRREASRRGVDPSRLVFASRMPSDVHLARHVHADLFLDTHQYNAHTTAVDALWTGLPVLTFRGTTMAARVATALLHAIGLPELVARDRADYEARALHLAHDRAALRELRAKLTANRATCPLFDADRYRRAIEAAYVMMWTRNEAGDAPVALDVAPDGAVTARPIPHR